MTWLGGHCCHQWTPGSAADARIDSEPSALLCPTGTWRRLALAQPGFTVCFHDGRQARLQDSDTEKGVQVLGSRKEPQASRSEVRAEVRLAVVVVVK